MSAEGFTVKGTGRFAGSKAEVNVQSMVVAAFAYVSGEREFPAFRRWCLEHATGDAAMADWLAGMSPSALRGLAGAFSGEEPEQS